jgi:hypothetical protein
MTMTPTRQAKTSETAEPSELLIKEAQAASRRRRLRWLAVSSAVALAACLLAALIVGGSKPATRIGGGENPKGTPLTLALCTTANLRVASDRAGWHANFAAAGQFSEVLFFTNVANSECQLKGWPHVQAVVNGIPESIPMRHVLQSGRPAVVRLAPNQSASFEIFGGDWDPVHNEACPQTTNGLMVAAPGTSKSVFVKVEEPFCGGFDISPVIFGSTDRESWTTTVQ